MSEFLAALIAFMSNKQNMMNTIRNSFASTLWDISKSKEGLIFQIPKSPFVKLELD